MTPDTGLAESGSVSCDSVTPIPVPHRAEHSETVGFRIAGPSRSLLYIPDVDRWEDWEAVIEQLIAGIDAAYLDGTFFSDNELKNRNVGEIPHPRIADSLLRLLRENWESIHAQFLSGRPATACPA